MSMTPLIWDFKKSKFVPMGGSGSGTLINVESVLDNGIHTGKVVTDTGSGTGNAITLASGQRIEYGVEGLSFGLQSVTLRMRSSVAVSGTGTVATIQTLYKNGGTTQVLSTTQIKANYFDAVNVYKDLGFVTNFKGTQSEEKLLYVIITANASSITFDNFQIAPTFPGATAVPTVLS